MKNPLVIAIDGPAASGKGTLARRLAEYLHLPHLDTGRLYRAVAHKVLKQQNSLEDRLAISNAALAISLEDMRDPELQTEEVARAASVVSAFPEVRSALLQFQRNFAANIKGAVLDGRDIGTVVCPEATIKIFITADIKSRAKRRFKELQQKGIKVIYDQVLADLQERDKRDSKRHISPLVIAEGAICIDTTDMDADTVFSHALSLLDPYLKVTTST